LALLALGIGPGDDVLVPTLTFAATANAVIACGARPVFCDVNEDDFAIDVEDAAARVTPATRVVIAVHLYGQAADMDAVYRLAQAHGLMLVEDACQAPGATYEGRRVGSFGVGTFSTYATKNLTTGEGGVVTTSSDDIETRLRLLRNHGMARRNVHAIFGLNLRMGEVQAAIGRVQLGRLPATNAKRKENAAFFTATLQGIDGLVLPREIPGRDHVWHQYTVRVLGGDYKRRNRVLRALRSSGVGAQVYYPIPLHKQPAFRGAPVSLPEAERLAGEVLSIPVHPSLCADERAAVSDALARAMARV
jgi:perosamine synthetase